LRNNDLTIARGLVNVWYYLFAVEPSDRKRAKVVDPDVEYYKTEFRDIVIYSLDADDESEDERYEYAKKMIIKYNDFGVGVHICQFKERECYKEDWTEYKRRLEKFQKNVKEKRAGNVASQPDLYKLFGRTLAKEL
jgi:hypothetical protein